MKGPRCRIKLDSKNPAQVSASGVGLPFGAPFRCKHRIKHRKRAPGQRGLRVGANLLSRNLDGNQIAWKYRRCAGHANLLFRDGVKRQVGKCDCLLEFTTRPELSQSGAGIWPQQNVAKRLKNFATRNSRARSQNRRLAICMALDLRVAAIPTRRVSEGRRKSFAKLGGVKGLAGSKAWRGQALFRSKEGRQTTTNGLRGAVQGGRPSFRSSRLGVKVAGSEVIKTSRVFVVRGCAGSCRCPLSVHSTWPRQDRRDEL